MPSEQAVCVSLLSIVSRCFPFLHGDETGTASSRTLSFPSHERSRLTWRQGTLGPPSPSVSRSAMVPNHKVLSWRRNRLTASRSWRAEPRRAIASTCAMHVHGGRDPQAICSGDTLYETPCSQVTVILQVLIGPLPHVCPDLFRR